jgi:5-methylcytosine-specific restriction protein A
MSRFYDTWRWKRLRRQQLLREPLCRMCASQNSIVVATDADHIKPIADGGTVDDFASLQSLCHAHHSQKTRSEQTGKTLTPKTKGASATGMPIDPAHWWSEKK